jgi:hypothetical protein
MNKIIIIMHIYIKLLMTINFKDIFKDINRKVQANSTSES